MKDPLGHDPLGLDGVVQIKQQVNPRLHRAVDAYRKNILVRGTTQAYSVKRGNGTPAPVGPPIGEDGLPLTEERRRELAAARTKYSVDAAREGTLDYVKSDAPIATEKLGASAQKAIDAQPEFTVVFPYELELTPEMTADQQAELDRAQANKDANE